MLIEAWSDYKGLMFKHMQKGIRKNKSLDTVAEIERAIQTHCDGLCMDDDNDRAQLSWWIYNNFCRGDYRENLKSISPAIPDQSQAKRVAMRGSPSDSDSIKK